MVTHGNLYQHNEAGWDVSHITITHVCGLFCLLMKPALLTALLNVAVCLPAFLALTFSWPV